MTSWSSAGQHPAVDLVLVAVLDDREDVPGGDAVLRPLDLGRGELLLDHELLDGAGLAAVGLGPVRHHVAGLDELGALLLGGEVLDRVGEGLHLGADRVGLRRELDVLGADHALAAEVDEVDGGLVGVDEVEQRRGAPHVEVGVVLPGDGDAAVHLRVEVGAQVGGRRRERGGDRGGVGELVVADLGGHGGVPHRAGGELGGHAHVGAVVLHRLVHGDRPAELDPLLRVGGGQLGALEGHAHRLRRQEQPVAVDEGLAGAGEHGARRAVEGDAGRAAGGVEVLGRVDGDAVAHLDDGDVVAGQHEQHVGERRRRARRRALPEALPSVIGDRRRRGRRRRTSSRRRGRAECFALVASSATASSVALAITVGTNGPGRHRAPELLDHHHELLEPVARAAVLLGEVEAEPAELHEVAPERRQLLGLGLEQGRAAPRDSRLVRKSDAVSDSARWSSEMAIDMPSNVLDRSVKRTGEPLVEYA